MSVHSSLFLPQNHGDTRAISMSRATARLPDIVIVTAAEQNSSPVGSNANNGTSGLARMVNMGENSSTDSVFLPMKWLMPFTRPGIQV